MNAHADGNPPTRTSMGTLPGDAVNSRQVPKGIEVLVKKASLDTEFCELLVQHRGAAAAAIELTLDRAETAIFTAIPDAQLRQIIAQTQVPVEQGRVFLGKVAAAMLLALGAGVLAGCSHKTPQPTPIGGRPDIPAQTNARPIFQSAMGQTKLDPAPIQPAAKQPDIFDLRSSTNLEMHTYGLTAAPPPVRPPQITIGPAVKLDLPLNPKEQP